LRTTSAFQVLSSLDRAVLHLSVVMSSVKEMHPGTCLMGNKSMPAKETKWSHFFIKRENRGNILMRTDDHAGNGHVLFGHLHPSSWCCAEIDQNPRLLQETEFSVQLDQLESSTRPVA